MSSVETVLGKIDTKDFGVTLIHEHIVASDWNQKICLQGFVDYDKVSDEVAQNLIEMKKKYNITTYGDLTPWSLGRDVRLLEKIAQKAGVNILCVTGVYADDQPYFRGVSEDTLVKFFLKDVYEGMEGSKIKPSAVKCATDEKGVTNQNKTLLNACARVAKESGLPIFTHTFPHNGCGLIQQNIFERHGVDLHKVVIGHCGDSNDIDYIEKILKRGSYVGLDRFGQDKHNSFENRMKTLMTLLDRGWMGKIILSHDHLVYCTNDVYEVKKHSPKRNPDIDLSYIHENVLPMLRDNGFSKEDIDTLLIKNPRRIFE